MFNPEPLVATWLSVCPRCDQTRFSLVGGFRHDVRCWGVRVALYNVAFRILAAFGVVEPDFEDWEVT